MTTERETNRERERQREVKREKEREKEKRLFESKSQITYSVSVRDPIGITFHFSGPAVKRR